MQAYHAQTRYRDEHERVVLVRSSLCSYHVTIEEDTISLRGPGVDESSDREELPPLSELEDLAIICVIYFEDSLWPKD